MEKVKSSTEVVVVDPKSLLIPSTTAQVPDAIEALKAQLKALKGQNDDTLSLDVSYEGTNISKVTSVRELLMISMSIHKKSEAYNQEISRYGLEAMNIAPFDETPIEKWEKIIQKAINELVNKTQIAKLENAIKALSNHLDAETKLKNELEGIMNTATQAIL